MMLPDWCGVRQAVCVSEGERRLARRGRERLPAGAEAQSGRFLSLFAPHLLQQPAKACLPNCSKLKAKLYWFPGAELELATA